MIIHWGTYYLYFSCLGVVKLLGVIRKIKNYDVIELYIRNETETAK